MSKKAFIKESAIYTIGDILPKAIVFFLIPIYTKYLTTAETGIVNVVTTIGSILSMFYILGLNGSLTRYYYDYDDDKKRELISTYWIFTVAFNLLLTFLLLAVGEGAGKFIFKSIPFDPFLKLTILNCLFSTFSMIPLTLFRLKEQAVRFGIISGLTIIINTLFIIYFIVFLKQGAEGNLKGYVYSNAIFAIIYTILIFKDLKLKFSFKMLKEGIIYGIPLIPHSIGGWVLSVSDRLFLNKYSSLDEIGVYSIGYQFGLLLDYVLGGINKAYVPFFFKTAATEKNAKSVFEEIIKYYSVFILSIGLGLALFSKEIVLLMVSNKSYYRAAGVVPLIAVVSVIHGYYYMSVNGIFYTKKTPILAITTLISALTAILFNFILIPRYGMYGAAFATMAAYVVLFVLTHYNSQKYYRLKWYWRDITVNALLCIAVYFAGTISYGSFLINLLMKAIMFIIYVILLFVFKILSYDVLKRYVGIITKR